jgi:subtilisin family serine protease
MGVRVINASFGGYSYSQALKDAIDASSALVLAAAGNDGMNNDTTGHYPSGYTSANVLAVAMSTQTGGISVYSNFGATSVDLAAPGMYILSSIPAPRATLASDSFADGTLGTWSTGGTSSWIIESGALSDASGSYANSADSWVMRSYGTAGGEGCTLQYSLSYSLETQQDFLYLETSPDGASWVAAAEYSGSESRDTYLTGLPPAGPSGSLYVRFRIVADESIASSGATIDDIALACAGGGYDGSVEYEFEHGTSMATPLVSGAAGLLLSLEPTLTAAELKERILDAVDPDDSMSGLVATGGRLNVLNIFYPPPADLAAPSVGSGSVTLTWTDRTSVETAYAVERSLAASESYAEVALLAADTTAYTDGDVSSRTSYIYRVRAWSPTVGYSSYSSELSVTTASGGSAEDGGGPCFIATAAYGSPLAGEVEALRSFRDRYLMTNAPGRALVMLYYRYSPPAADVIARDERLRAFARLALAPVVVGVSHPRGVVMLAVVVAAIVVPVFVRGRARRRKDT